MVSAGACTLSWPGLTYPRKAGLPLIATEVPSKTVGARDPEKSVLDQVRVLCARLLPLISSQEPEAKLDIPPKSLADFTEAICGRGTLHGAAATAVNCTGGKPA